MQDESLKTHLQTLLGGASGASEGLKWHEKLHFPGGNFTWRLFVSC